jgi:hypothetical protein
VAGIWIFVPNSGEDRQNLAQNGRIPAILARSRLDWPGIRPNLSRIPARWPGIQPFWLEWLDPSRISVRWSGIGPIRPVWPKYGTVQPESGDGSWMSPDSSTNRCWNVACRNPAIVNYLNVKVNCVV